MVNVVAQDAAGNSSPGASVTVDSQAPAAPVVNPSNGTTLSGTAEPGATVTHQHSQQLVDAEAKARADGDAATLADAKAHTDQTVAAEAQARADGDAQTLASANQHSQQLVDAEAKARADGDCSAPFLSSMRISLKLAGVPPLLERLLVPLWVAFAGSS